MPEEVSLPSVLNTPDDLQEYDQEAFFDFVRLYHERIEQELAENVQATMHIDQQDDALCVATVLFEKEGHEGAFFTRFVMNKNEDESVNTNTIMSSTAGLAWSVFRNT